MLPPPVSTESREPLVADSNLLRISYAKVSGVTSRTPFCSRCRSIRTSVASAMLLRGVLIDRVKYGVMSSNSEMSILRVTVKDLKLLALILDAIINCLIL